jgi:hypothetical protein
MYRGHVRYARIRFDSRLKKKSLDAPCNLSPMGSESSLLFYRSSGFVIETGKYQGASISSSPVGCSPWRYKEDRQSAHMFSGSLAGTPVLVCGADCGYLPRDTFIRGLPLCQRRPSTWRSKVTVTLGSRTVASRGTGFESPIFSAHCCDVPRAAPVGRRP